MQRPSKVGALDDPIWNEPLGGGVFKADTQSPRKARTIVVIVVVAASVALGVNYWVGRDSGANATALVPARTYGPTAGRYVVSFGAPPKARMTVQIPANRYLNGMAAFQSNDVAALAPDADESVVVTAYPHDLTKGNVDWYIHWLTDFHPETWHGLPGAVLDDACRLGDSPQTCPGRYALRVIIAGNVIYELQAIEVSESEVQRFFGSFHLA